MSKPTAKVFISYAHADGEFFEVFRQGLSSHLFTSDKYSFTSWDDSKLLPGTLWDNEIQESLGAANLAILCVSANFLNSSYIEAKEFGILIEKFPNTIIVPVYFRHCNIKAWSELSKRQFFKPDGDKYGIVREEFAFSDLVRFNESTGKPIPNADIDLYCKHLVEKIEKAFEKIPHHPAATVPGPKTPNYLNATIFPYFNKHSFFGREKLLESIHEQLLQLDVPLLLSGIGGMGKTAVAVAYGKEAAYSHHYDNIVWVDVAGNIFNGLFNTFQKIPPGLFEYDANGSREADIEKLMHLLANLPGRNLLVIDNANDEKDLLDFIGEWKIHNPKWKCLITTRCEDNSYKRHTINIDVIDPEAAASLFTEHYKKPFDTDSFEKTYEYSGGHTFLIELLAKYSQESLSVNNLADLVRLIQSKGIRGLNEPVIAKRGQHKKEKSELVSDFVIGLYDPLSLSPVELQYMRYLSILPAKEFHFDLLNIIFGIKKPDKDKFSQCLISLAKRGWLIRNNNAFKCHQIIQEICKDILKPDADNCKDLVMWVRVMYQQRAVPNTFHLLDIGSSVINNLREVDPEIGLLKAYLGIKISETGNLSLSLTLLDDALTDFTKLKIDDYKSITLQRIQVIYRTRGEFDKALQYCFKYKKLKEKLIALFPEMDHHKSGLAIAYQDIGSLYAVKGNLKIALEYHKKFHSIMDQLSKKNPEDNYYKRGLALTYEHVGKTYLAQEKPKIALKWIKKMNDIVITLAEKDPSNVDVIKPLAISFQYLGQIYTALGDHNLALTHYKKLNMIAEVLARENPEIIDYKFGYALSFQFVGNGYFDLGDKAEALKNYIDFNTTIKNLTEEYPDHVSYQNALAISYINLGKVTNGEQSKHCYMQAEEVLKALTVRAPLNVHFHKHLEHVQSALKKFDASEEEELL